MREIRPSGSEGGVRSIPHPYPYRGSAVMRSDARRCPLLHLPGWPLSSFHEEESEEPR